MYLVCIKLFSNLYKIRSTYNQSGGLSQAIYREKSEIDNSCYQAKTFIRPTKASSSSKQPNALLDTSLDESSLLLNCRKSSIQCPQHRSSALPLQVQRFFRRVWVGWVNDQEVSLQNYATSCWGVQKVRIFYACNPSNVANSLKHL
jgi:hypothetical protein